MTDKDSLLLKKVKASDKKAFKEHKEGKEKQRKGV